MTMRVAGLWIWPVKGCAGLRVDAVDAGHFGPEGDRRFMIIDAEDRMVTQRDEPRLATIRPMATGDTLQLEMPDGRTSGPLAANGSLRTVTVWKDDVEAVDCGDAVAGLLSDALQRSVRLVRMSSGYRRPVSRRWAERDADTSFTDGFPWLLVNRSSIEALSRVAGMPLQPERFRPNLLIEGAPAFAEDHWRHIQIGPVKFQVAKPCTRCRVITLDPMSGKQDAPRLLRTLAEHRQDGQPVFGQNLVHLNEGTIRVGDAVQLNEAA
ncbi:MAG: MOSC domain-containing protein [Candidatus Dadabacteria bacterium]|nr:MAG: MOSC domain-containing protein [Candidatus Dadabacteria bacterium]